MALNPLNCWTVNFLRDWGPVMTVPSLLRWRDYCLRETHNRLSADRQLRLRLRPPVATDVHLREIGSDYHTFLEVMGLQVYRAVVETVPGCRTVIDLGANIGLATLYLAGHYPASRLVAVEPNPDNYRVLEANLQALIAGGRCQTIEAAVWSSERPLAPCQPGEECHYNAFAVTEQSSPANGGAAIQGMTIERILELSGFDEVDLLKIDIEGAETELLRGDVSWLERVGAIAIEFHADSRIESGFDPIMERYGFQTRQETSHTVLAVKTGAAESSAGRR